MENLRLDSDAKILNRWTRLKKKDTKMPRELSSWNFFKSYFLRNEELMMEINSMTDIESVQKRIIEKLHEMEIRYWPKWVRNALHKKRDLVGFIRRFVNECLDPQLPFQLIHQKHGIGIISKTDDFMLLKKHLVGKTQVIPEELIDEVTSQQYSSLILNNQGERAVLYGPLSFLNHECESMIHFQVVPNSNIATIKMVDQDLELPIKKRKRNGIEINKEICVTYCNSEDLWFFCKCNNCKWKINQLYKMIKDHTGFVDRDSILWKEGDEKVPRSITKLDVVPNTISAGYGELTSDAFTTILSKFHEMDIPLIEDSVFLDIGSGFGKPVFHVSVQYQVSRSTGIDFYPIYIEKCNQIKAILGRNDYGFDVSTAEFHLGDATSDEFNHIYDQATHIYCYNRVFSPITDELIFSKLKASRSCKVLVCFTKSDQVAELTENAFDFKGTCQVRTTGKQSFTCYFYTKRDA